mmetsp:Transcript_18131/g.43574  ORF Transcript_18131/g.43574 Transcript_18131/m.43574 type:complete len:185 (-) Transcript_18131:155-709(-)
MSRYQPTQLAEQWKSRVGREEQILVPSTPDRQGTAGTVSSWKTTDDRLLNLENQLDYLKVAAGSRPLSRATAKTASSISRIGTGSDVFSQMSGDGRSRIQSSRLSGSAHDPPRTPRSRASLLAAGAEMGAPRTPRTPRSASSAYSGRSSLLSAQLEEEVRRRAQAEEEISRLRKALETQHGGRE